MMMMMYIQYCDRSIDTFTIIDLRVNDSDNRVRCTKSTTSHQKPNKFISGDRHRYNNKLTYLRYFVAYDPVECMCEREGEGENEIPTMTTQWKMWKKWARQRDEFNIGTRQSTHTHTMIKLRIRKYKQQKRGRTCHRQTYESGLVHLYKCSPTTAAHRMRYTTWPMYVHRSLRMNERMRATETTLAWLCSSILYRISNWTIRSMYSVYTQRDREREREERSKDSWKCTYSRRTQ